ncbi:MAG: L-2-amino-thiazoline-4-carboxylic acid hydrolase [Clostridia bacterium]|nr:L-2-amino-thiazoline-4-carboxylic acid hydrolase [Clostridia bacterium]
MFSETVHAYLIAAWFDAMSPMGDRGLDAFRLAVRLYGESRGRRMAQRCVRDGEKLTVESYLAYCEWRPSGCAVQEGISNVSQVLEEAPARKVCISRCPWHHTFEALGAGEAGRIYCREIDAAIARGFSPEFTYRAERTLMEHDACLHVLEGPMGKKIEMRDTYVQDFRYHCANLHFLFEKTARAVFGAEGGEMAERVIVRFQERYGDEMTGEMLEMRDTDFMCAPTA